MSSELERGPATGSAFKSVVVLAGGVGGAKLAAGLQSVLPPGSLSVVVNTADDFRLWGLHISPDTDTVMYTLAGIANPETGWGISGETWNALEMISMYRRDAWFRIGDRDLATHVLRTQMLATGRSLTDITGDLSTGLGIPTRILPMCDEPVSTLVHTPEGDLEFQEYFVRHRHKNTVTGFTFRGIEEASPTRAVERAISEADAIIFGPSNPFVSIGPILAVPGMRDLIKRSSAPKVAVSPIVGGAAIKGPAADMLRSLDHEVSPVGVAALYKGLVDGMVIDLVDSESAGRFGELGMGAHAAPTVITGEESRSALASEVLAFAGRLSKRPAT